MKTPLDLSLSAAIATMIVTIVAGTKGGTVKS